MKRIESMAEVIKEELARQVLREIELPEGVLLTITRVEITDDKQQAGVFFSLLGGSDNTDEMRRQILDLLFKATPFLQRMLNRQLRTRPVPRIRFLIDEEELKRQRVEELLGQIQEKEL